MILSTIVLLLLGIQIIKANENYVENTNTHPVYPKLPASILPDEVDILKLINVTNKDPGVSLIEGPIPNYPAYKFRIPFGNMPLINSTTVTNALNNTNGFTILFLYRQQKNNLGTLLSINSPGKITSWLQVNSNSKYGTFSLKYRLQNRNNKLKQIEWDLPKHHGKLPLAAWTWLSLVVDYHTELIRFDLDCQPSKFESLSKYFDLIKIPQNSLVYFRQEPGRKKKFLGSMQIAKILPYPYEIRPWSCMEIADNLPPTLRKPIIRL